MNLIPRFYYFNIFGWNFSINSLYLFELLAHLARIIIQINLYYLDFPVAYFTDSNLKSVPTRVVKIKLVPIGHTYAQS